MPGTLQKSNLQWCYACEASTWHFAAKELPSRKAAKQQGSKGRREEALL